MLYHGWNEMLYLTTHSKVFIYSYMGSNIELKTIQIIRKPTKKKGFNKRLNILKEGRKEMFYLTMHSTHFIYGYMASDI